MTARKPLIIAHRGGSRSHGENTGAAFEHAFAANVDMLECDLRQTGDGELVLIHDAAVHLDGQRMLVADTPVARLRKALPFLLTLDEFLESYGRRLPFNLDLKTHGYELPALRALQRHQVVEQTLFSTVHSHSLYRLARAGTQVKLGLSRGHLASSLPNRIASQWLRIALPLILPATLRLSQATATMLQFRVVTPYLVQQLQDRGYQVFVWTVDEEREALRLRSYGVDGIATNVPDRIIPALS